MTKKNGEHKKGGKKREKQDRARKTGITPFPLEADDDIPDGAYWSLMLEEEGWFDDDQKEEQ